LLLQLFGGGHLTHEYFWVDILEFDDFFGAKFDIFSRQDGSRHPSLRA